MNILALDLGTHTGFAYNRGEEFFCGTWTLATAKEITAWGKQRLTRRDDPRIERLCKCLKSLGRFDFLVFEDVEFSTYTKQTQLWASFRATVWLCADAMIKECVPVGTLKKFATGHGGATKEMMKAAMLREKKLAAAATSYLWDDNAVDAAWIWLWAQRNFSRAKV